MTSYSNAAVFSGAGQNFTINLSDGSVFSFTLTATGTTGLAAIAPPSWTGSAVGNTAFLGIPNRPILYTTGGGTVNLTMGNILVTPPPGVTGSGQFKVVIADAESTNNGESLTYTTNVGGWTVIDQVNPISGSTYPTITNSGNTFTETGVAGTVGAYIVGTESPTTVTARLVAGGLQGIMFAVQYATISANKTIAGARANAADQFVYGIRTTASGTVLAQSTSSGAGNGPFGSAVATVSSGVATTVYEQMAAGSVSSLAQYNSTISCTNNGSSTGLPTGLAATTYNIPTVAYNDAIACVFTNTPRAATVAIQKVTVGAAGGAFSFTQVNLASNPSNITTSSPVTATPAAPTAIQVSALNTQVQVTEGTNPNFNITSAACTDQNAAVTGNPASFGTLAGSTLTIPAARVLAAAQIVCTFTNTARAPTLRLQKALSGSGRIAGSDQFVLQVTGTGAPGTVTTTGSGTAVTSAAINFNATAGSTYTFNEIMSGGSASPLTSYSRSIGCTNSNPSGTNVSGFFAVPSTIVPASGDGISCTITNAPIITTLSIVKTPSTAGPVIRGQVYIYSYAVTNTGNVALTNVRVADLHGTPAVAVALGAGGITNETLTTPGPFGAGASTNGTANDGIWNTLAPGATVTFTYTHTVTLAEFDRG